MGMARCSFLITGLFVMKMSCPVRAETIAWPTNMDLVTEAVQRAVDDALADMTLSASAVTGPVFLDPGTQHVGNWLVAHVLAERLLERGFRVTLDSTAAGVDAHRLWYRILDMHVGGRAGLLRSTIHRRAESTIAFRVSRGGVLLWQKEYHTTAEDQIPKNRVDLLANDDYSFAKTDLKEQTVGQFVEPVIVSGVLGGLIYMFFSNR